MTSQPHHGGKESRFVVDAEVTANQCVAPEHFRMRFAAPEIAAAAAPGQFCMLQVSEGYAPFLRRPMCFEWLEDDSFTVLYKVEGEGTRLLSRLQPGARISVQGPLGRGWPLERDWQRHILVGGGIGIAPLPALARVLVEVFGEPPEVVLAARTADSLVDRELFEELGCTVHLATDDGSAGVRGFAHDVLENLKPGPDTRVYACGPMVMMRAVSNVATHAGAGCLVSLEARMACGDGACLGCVVESTRTVEGERMVRVCMEGPVFDTGEIDWEAHGLAYDVNDT